MLKEGIYEQLITTSLKEKINQISVDRFYVNQTSIDKEEAAKVLSTYLIDLIQFALKEIKEENSIEKQIVFCNEIIAFIDKKLNFDSSESLIALEGQILTA